jgi:ADP-heptose:LPS heptosyltransferase/GT2 family glycosyltransferase
MFLSISVLLYGKPQISEMFFKTLKTLLKDRNDTEVIVLDNGCSFDDVSERVVLSSGIKNLTYIPSGINLGFGQGHCHNLELATGELFMVVNNDINFTDGRAIDRLTLPFQSVPDIALIGLEDAPCSLKVDRKSGYVSGFKGSTNEYAEGSCLVGRTELFRKYGLFSPAFEYWLFEDGDLSLRFRQMGLKMTWARVPHKHLRSSSLNLIPKTIREYYTARNCERFKKRWEGYLMNRQFVNRVLIKMESLGIGDILAMTPILEGVRKDHPTAIIELTTSFPEVFVSNPYINELYEIKREYRTAYDRTIDVKPNFASYELIAKESERIAATKINSYLPQIYFTRMELDGGAAIVNSVREEADDIVIGVSLRNSRPAWQGKCWSVEYTTQLIGMIQDTGAKVIELGKDIDSTGVSNLDLVNQLSLREFFSVVAGLDALVTIDSLALHVAQATATPTFALFGATAPEAYIVDWGTVFPIWNEDLNCVGCYQRKGVNNFNSCAIKTELCMTDLTPEKVMEKILMSRDALLQRNIEILQNIQRNEKCI